VTDGADLVGTRSVEAEAGEGEGEGEGESVVDEGESAG
jgi:hypothetical protein